MTEKVISFRVDEKLNNEIETESKLEGQDKSEILRRLIQEAIDKRKIGRAIDKYLNGTLGLSSAAIETNLSIWDFLNELNQSNKQINFDLEGFLNEVDTATEHLSKLLKSKEK